MSALPRSVTLLSASRLLRIEWDDDSASALPHALLRARCRCAFCTKAARAGAPPEDCSEVALTEAHAMAGTGLNLVFSDGHRRGIYPWAYLRELGALSEAGDVAS
ncbi:MAG: DUF971 domain-containing protein [Methyloversatilis sp.]|uniref:DUF971 domain-containing protein n=1 Tax=Methyloversatilis sp. TaxID=2569862 RepID=UPI00273244D8|nr:DUF971 domain-containing protein [Methyloversatilis sp.]MDP3873181.1 DUF971 domain-containing protein [Methyloversatilis sp.]